MVRQATQMDFDFIYNLYMHPQVNPFILYEWMDAKSFEPVYDDLMQQSVKYIYHNAVESVGMFKLIPLKYRTAHIAYLGGLAIHPAYAGQGEGKKMLAEILASAGARGFLRIELSVAYINTKAIQLYEKSGFKKEGVLRKYLHLKSEGRFIVELMMAFLF